jgi:uncharacterized membrane protein YhaH (DUF805 family)
MERQKRVKPWERKIYWVLVLVASVVMAVIISKAEPTSNDIFGYLWDFILAFIGILLLTSLWEKQLADKWKSTPIKK